ncbi:MAG: hypothetical protein F4X77_06405 [Acidobacteriia bacterium]|nr:hypothetical protein [Terriglobia bacterium]MYC65788.1 hypothetical protein [Terriglobia bacterium]
MFKQPTPRSGRLHSTAGEGQTPLVAIVLLVGIALLAGLNVYTFLQLDKFRTEVSEQFATHEVRLSALDGNLQRTTEATSELGSQVGEVASRVQTNEEQIVVKTQAVESRVLDRAETLEQEIAITREASEAQISEVGGRLDATKTEIGELGGEVDTVKEDVAATKSLLDETVAALTTVKGDLGVQSGLIATNGDELAALKALGERNYYEFNLGRTKNPQRVGPVSIKLTGTDRKRNRYSIELWADDKKIVKRRKTLLEPVQFYVEGVRIPYELVVNRIDSGLIEGYLATPKGGPRGA